MYKIKHQLIILRSFTSRWPQHNYEHYFGGDPPQTTWGRGDIIVVIPLNEKEWKKSYRVQTPKSILLLVGLCEPILLQHISFFTVLFVSWPVWAGTFRPFFHIFEWLDAKWSIEAVTLIFNSGIMSTPVNLRFNATPERCNASHWLPKKKSLQN